MYLTVGFKTIEVVPVINITLKPTTVIMDFVAPVPLGIDQLWSDMISASYTVSYFSNLVVVSQ